MKKHYFEEFKDQVEEEHKAFKTKQEAVTISTERCNHKGKVKMVKGLLRCSCGAAWGGTQLETLMALLK